MVRTAVLGMVVPFAVLAPASVGYVAPARCYDWILREKLRGGYLSCNTPLSGVPQMQAAGMNLLMPKFGGLQSPPTDDNAALLQAWAEAASQAGMRLMPVLNFRGGETERIVGVRREVGAAGQRMEQTPCPLDEEFWRRCILDRLVYLAERAGELHLDGAIIDPEMYGADHTVYSDECYCDACLREFLHAVGHPAPAPLPKPSRRLDWLGEQELGQRFEEHFISRVRSLCAQIEAEVHSRNPAFIIGVLLLDYPLPFMRGMAQGLGTEAYPVVGFSESTYSPGFTEYVDRQQEAFAALPAHVLFAPGIWQQQFPSENLAEQYYTCAAHSTGYWIYTFESLLEDCSKLPGYQLREPHERYWEAMRTANEELDKLVASDGTYVSPLKVRPSDPPLPVLTTADIKIEPLMPAPGGTPLSPGAVTVPRLRYRNPAYILCKAGEPVEARVTNLQLANYRPGTQYAVVDAEGNRVLEGTMKVTESATVTFTPRRDGVHVLVAESGQNSHSVQVLTGQRWAFKAEQGMPLIVNGVFGRVYFWVPDGIAGFSVFARAEGHASGKGGALTVYRPDGQAASHIKGDLGAWTEMTVGVPPEGQARIWALSAEGLTNDLTVYLSGNVSPYVSTDPGRLPVKE